MLEKLLNIKCCSIKESITEKGNGLSFLKDVQEKLDSHLLGMKADTRCYLEN